CPMGDCLTVPWPATPEKVGVNAKPACRACTAVRCDALLGAFREFLLPLDTTRYSVILSQHLRTRPERRRDQRFVRGDARPQAPTPARRWRETAWPRKPAVRSAKGARWRVGLWWRR